MSKLIESIKIKAKLLQKLKLKKDPHFKLKNAYQKHFFVCDEHYIRFLGYELSNPEILATGRNWAHPLNASSLETIKNRIRLKNKRT